MCVSLSSNADPVLIGCWKSDHASTLAYAREHLKISQKTDRFLSDIMGHMVMTFTDDTITLDMPDWNITTGSGTKKMKGFHNVEHYKLLGSSPDQVVIQTQSSLDKRNQIGLYTFDGPDKMWVYVTSLKSPVREFFVRIA